MCGPLDYPGLLRLDKEGQESLHSTISFHFRKLILSPNLSLQFQNLREPRRASGLPESSCSFLDLLGILEVSHKRIVSPEEEDIPKLVVYRLEGGCSTAATRPLEQDIEDGMDGKASAADPVDWEPSGVDFVSLAVEDDACPPELLTAGLVLASRALEGVGLVALRADPAHGRER